MTRPAVRRRARSRRPRADHAEGRAADRRGRRGRLPRRHARQLIARSHRRRPDPRRCGRGAAGLPGDHRHRRAPGWLRGRDGRLLRGVGRAARRAPGGRTDVVLLAEGDPLFYGSYMYMHDRLAGRYPHRGGPGVTSVSARVGGGRQPAGAADRRADRAARHAARAGARPPARRHPGRGDHEARPHVPRRASRARGRPAGWGTRSYVERASTDRQVVLPVKDVDPRAGAVLLASSSSGRGQPPRARPRHERRGCRSGRAVRRPRTGELLVVGLGPAGDGGSPPRRRRRWPGSTTSSATRPTSTASRSGRPAAARVRQHRRGGAGPLRTRPRAVRRAGRGLSRQATPASSGWRRRCSRRPRTSGTSTYRRPGGARHDGGAGRRRPGPVHRSAGTSR